MKNKLIILSIFFILSISLVNGSIIIQDSFNRSNCVLGGANCNATNGNIWSVNAGSPDVVSNQGTFLTGDDADLDITYTTGENITFYAKKNSASDKIYFFLYDNSANEIAQMIYHSSTNRLYITDGDGIGGYTFSYYDNGFSDSTWHKITLYNINMTTYTYDVEVDTTKYTNGGSHWGFTNDVTISNIRFYSNTGTGYFDELVTTSGGSAPTPSSDEFLVTAKNYYDDSSINIFNITLDNGSVYSTTNGTIYSGILQNNTNLWNFTIKATDHFNNITLNYNVSSNLQTVLKQSEIDFNCYEKITNSSLTCLNNTIYPNAGLYNFTIGVSGYYDVITNNTNITALDNKTINVYDFANSYLNISAINIRTNASINNFTITYTDLTTSWSETLTADGTYLNNSLIEGRNYTIEINALGYEYKAINITNLTKQDYEFSLYTANSILISIKKESDGSLIYDNVTVRFTDALANVVEYETNTSSLYVDNLSVTNYTLAFISANYSTRTYEITVGNKTFQTLTAYLVDDGVGASVFEFQNKNTGATLEGVTLTIQKLINTSWTVVEVLNSDVTGRTSFDYIDDETYRFIASKSGYETKQFTLDPILFTSYTIKMDPTVTQADDSDYSGVNIYIDPKIYYNNQNNTITLTFISPAGEFVSYGFNATYKTTTVSGSGANAYGSIVTNILNITGATALDVVVLNYNYELSDGDIKEYTKVFTIDGSDATDGTFLKGLTDHYGLGIFERILIVVSLVMLVAGAGAYFGGGTAGGVLALFLFGLFAYTGFIPLWSVIITMIVLFIILTWRSSL